MDYSAGIVPENKDDLARFLREELKKLEHVLRESPARQLEFLHAAPARPRLGMIYGADGTDWNPGGGQGVYYYNGAAWTKL